MDTLSQDLLDTLTGALRILDDQFISSVFNAEEREMRERLRGLVETLAARPDKG